MDCGSFRYNKGVWNIFLKIIKDIDKAWILGQNVTQNVWNFRKQKMGKFKDSNQLPVVYQTEAYMFHTRD